MAFVDHRLAQRQGGLGVAERCAEHIGGAECARRCMHARVGNQAEHPGIACHLLDPHLHTGVHRANQHIDFVALNQLAGVFDAFAGL
ncbi:hypothetical protein D3C72_1774140 [compost metagenome]